MVDNQSVAGNYVVKVPTRNPQGRAVFRLALVSVAKDVHNGYLPYTRSNILKQAGSVELRMMRLNW